MFPSAHRHYQYKPLHVLTVATVACVAGSSITGVVISILELICESMWPGFNDPNLEFATETAAMAAQLIAGIAVLGIIPSLALIILVPRFSYRSNANLRSLGVQGLKYTPGWSAGYWFIPFANLIRPFQATSEVYLASEARLKNRLSPMSPFLGWWWGLYISGNIVSNIEMRMIMQGIYSAEWFHPVSLLSSGLTLAAGILFIRILLRISANQTDAGEF